MFLIYKLPHAALLCSEITDRPEVRGKLGPNGVGRFSSLEGGVR